MFVWFLNLLVNYWVISRTGPKTERLTILHAATHETELGVHDFCLSRSHYTDTDPASRERIQRESNPGPPHQEPRALPTELLRPRKTQLYVIHEVSRKCDLCRAERYCEQASPPKLITQVALHIKFLTLIC